MIAELMTCVVLTGMPNCEAVKTTVAAVVSAAKPVDRVELHPGEIAVVAASASIRR